MSIFSAVDAKSSMYAKAALGIRRGMNSRRGYRVLQFLGFRLYYFRDAISRGIPLDTFWGWVWEPMKEKGTYVENNAFSLDYENIGMLTQKESLVYLALTGGA